MPENDEFDKILQKYLEGKCTEEEKRLVDEWFFSLGMGESFDLEASRRETLRQRLWSGLDERTRHAAEEKPVRHFNYWKAGRIAASFSIIAVSVLFLWLGNRKDHKTGNVVAVADVPMVHVANDGAAPRSVALSDGSSILLEPQSEVTFPEVFTDRREIYLTGEAFFEVAKDAQRPFFVYTHELTTRVLGTSFRVKAWRQEKEIVVAVKTGRVSVFTRSDNKEQPESHAREIVLRPNQQAVYNRREQKVSATLVPDPHIIIAQPSLKMHYVNAPVAEILNALEETYGVEIQYSEASLAGCTLTTDLTDEGLYERVEIICNALNARYKVVDTQIIVESDGCR